MSAAIKRWLGAALACGVWASGQALADKADAPIELSIPAGELVSGLEQLAQQSRIEFVYDADKLRGIKTHGAAGHFTPKQAVSKLLEGTQLRLIEYKSGAMLIAAPQHNDGPMTSSQGPMVPALAPRLQADQKSSTGPRLEAIVVTGTHIAGVLPVGSAVSVYTRADIEQSGSATLDQFARQMPQNFSGADALATATNTNAGLGRYAQGAATNIFAGSGFNLNGLGPGSTLTLLNGHRLAPGSLDGSFVDISLIPLSAIDHIEVMDDGASAIYGSDAIAGVVNIITRRAFDGAQSSMQYGFAPDGGATEVTASQLFGKSWSTGNLLVDYEYDDQGGLDAAQRPWIDSREGPFSLIPKNRRNSVFGTGRERFGEITAVSATLLYTDRDFERDGTVEIPSEMARQHADGHARQSTASMSINRDLWAAWQGELTATYSQIDQQENAGPVVAFDALGPEMAQQRSVRASTSSLDTLASGEVLRLPGGEVKISIGASYRTEQLKSDEFSVTTATAFSLRRQVSSVFGELLIPVLGDANAIAGLRRLEFSAAYRFDYYSDFQSTAHPKFGLLWQPLADLRIRGTYQTSFQAPFLSQLGSPSASSTVLIPGSGSPARMSDVLEITGGNPDLRRARSTSFTTGFDYLPSRVPGFSASATFFHVLFENRIQSQPITSQPLLSQPLLLPYLLLDPSPDLVRPYFDSAGFQGDFAGYGPSGVNAILDNRLTNLAATIESGVNFSARYHLPTAAGEFDFSLSGTHLLADRMQAAALQTILDFDNTIAEPTNWRARGALGWARNEFSSTITINHVNAYENTLFVPSKPVGSWTTVDLYLNYHSRSARSPLVQNLKVALSVQNIAGRRPPSLQIPAVHMLTGQNPIPYDGTNASPVGRFVSLQITKDW